MTTTVLPAYYGRPIDTPAGHRWAGYDAPLDEAAHIEYHERAMLRRPSVLCSTCAPDGREPIR